jgi:hypothetical protein
LSTADIIAAIAALDPSEAPAILSAGYALMARAADKPNGTGDDELVDASEAARMLGMSESYLYHATKLAFRVKVGRRQMFSRNGIQKFINKQQGKA